MRSIRERKLPERSNAHLICRPVEEAAEERLFGPTMSAIRDPIPGLLTRL